MDIRLQAIIAPSIVFSDLISIIFVLHILCFIFTEAYLKPWPISMMELFAEIVNY